MIDSSKWSVIEAGLKCVQGKCIVNSISMKEGEEEFVRQARLVRALRRRRRRDGVRREGPGRHARAADRDLPARLRPARRRRSGFPPEDIIFDPNIFAIATGIEEHANYGVDFIEATRWIRDNLPHASVSGGVSNISFSFRGNDPVREAIHTAFLYHAIRRRHDDGDRQCRPARRLRRDIDRICCEHVEDMIFERGATTPPSAWSNSPRR